MTTIAYKDGVMAADSQSDWFYTEKNNRKLYKRGDTIIGVSGDLAYGKLFADWIAGKGDKPQIQENFAAIVVKNGKCLSYDKNLVPMASEQPVSIGSGSQFAIGAMDAGLNAKQAVKIASKRDSATGGRIHIETTRK